MSIKNRDIMLYDPATGMPVCRQTLYELLKTTPPKPFARAWCNISHLWNPVDHEETIPFYSPDTNTNAGFYGFTIASDKLSITCHEPGWYTYGFYVRLSRRNAANVETETTILHAHIGTEIVGYSNRWTDIPMNTNWTRYKAGIVPIKKGDTIHIIRGNTYGNPMGRVTLELDWAAPLDTDISGRTYNPDGCA